MAHTQPASSKARNDLATAELETYHLEDKADDRVLKRSLWVAGIAHAVFLLINFPNFVDDTEAAEPPPKKVFVVQQKIFKEPKIEEPRPPKKRVKKIPIPDPTPEAPEPIPTEEPDYEVDLSEPDIDLAWIPEAPPIPEPEGPIGVTGDVTRPVKTYGTQPQYTEMARRVRTQGVVIVEAIIDRQGNVTNVKLLKGLPMGLSEAAIQAVKTWKFKPATLRGKPVEVYYNLKVHFSLQ